MVIRRAAAVAVSEWVPAAWELRGTPGRRVRVGMITPSLTVGGAERHILTLLRSTDPEVVCWVGVAVTLPEFVGRDTAAEAERTCPVGIGWKAAAELSRCCDVVILWGIPRWWERLPHPLPHTGPGRCPVVLVSHGSGEWTRAVMEGCERAAAPSSGVLHGGTVRAGGDPTAGAGSRGGGGTWRPVR